MDGVEVWSKFGWVTVFEVAHGGRERLMPEHLLDDAHVFGDFVVTYRDCPSKIMEGEIRVGL